MGEPVVLTIHTDGASRGNPGAAAFAYVIAQEGEPPIEEAGRLGQMTNNQAEYTALVRALEHALELGPDHRLHIHSDSELLVKQMNGEYRVKNENLRELFQEAKRLLGRFQLVSIRHVPREQNGDADRLCNQALDGQRPKAQPSSKPKKPAANPSRTDAIREEAVECLRSAADAWRRHDPRAPKPQDVWEQLWSILEEHGMA